MSNQLQFEKSPYLLQHSENPVNWYPWGKEAFARARAEDKPIFLSIGYSTCHWCHVMAHESFEDPAVAQAVNSHFIPIKVDREERPDVDAVYMSACMAMTGSGGWPLTVLLTPEQKPFWAGTYLPKDSLLSLLSQAAQLWRDDRGHVLSAGEELTAYLQQEKDAHPGVPSRDLVNLAFSQFSRMFDPQWGGFGRAPKFPMPHNLIFLLRYAQRTGNHSAAEMAERTLEGMYRGGLFDHVGGGFSRYSTDERWLVPHFEKMLYDNALLTLAYTEGLLHTRRPLYQTIVRRTLDYVLRELKNPQGGFFCGQDADSEGVEGKYYVFTPEELTSVLGQENAQLFCRRYGVTAQGNFEGKSIPNLIVQQELEQESQEMSHIREQLLTYRRQRTTLHKDDKILTSWNGLMIAAVARAGLVLDEPRYLDAAREAADFIEQNLADQDGQLLARWREGHAAHPGKLEDYAFYAWGLLELYAVTLDLRYLARTEHLAEHLLEFFFDRDKGGFYPYGSHGEQLLTRVKEVYDGSLPSGNAVAALVLSRLSRLTGTQRWREAAQLQLEYLAGAVQDHPVGHSFAMLTFLEELWPSAELVCTAKETPAELMTFLRDDPHFELTTLVKTPQNQQELTTLAPFTADYPIPEQGAQYYLCRNGACAQPVEHISALRAQLTR